MIKKNNIETYTPTPIDTTDVALPEEIGELVEKLAGNTHDIWATGRIKEGWKYGDKRSDRNKTHPCLVPYDALPESEKEYDRNTAVETLKLIVKLGYSIVPASKDPDTAAASSDTQE